ncbi:MAG: hypothetical protein ABIK85_08215 [Candidatus Eisenbacteria bacterium]
MSGTFSDKQLIGVVASSLAIASGVYARRSDGDLVYDGVRPGPEWHAHGYFARRLWMLVKGLLVRRRLWKKRWIDPRTGRTVHSRPPDDAAQVWSCTLIVALKLWAVLDGGSLLVGHEVVPELQTHPSVRTVQRWLCRAVARADEVLHYIRVAVIERCEPRPVEHLFPSGLAPPESLLCRRWRQPHEIKRLWQALAWLFAGAIALSAPASLLLAEARGRMSATETSFPI